MLVDLLPGAQFRYSGGGTTITQQVLVDTFFKPYPAIFFRELSLARAGRSTKFSQRVAQEMTTRVDARAHVGLGVFVQERNGVGFFGHDGVDEGFNASASASLDGVRGLVMMANSAKGLKLFPEIERTVFAALGWEGADPPIVRVALSAAERAAWLGDFEREGDVPFTIRLEGERLMMTRALAEPVELVITGPQRSVHPLTGLRFWLQNGEIEIASSRGPLGRATPVSAGKKLPLLELAAGHEAAALDAWREQLNRDPTHVGYEVRLCLGYGHELLETNAPASALILFRACVRALPAFPALHAGLGAAYAAQGQVPAAIEAYETALVKLEDANWLAPGQKQSLRESVQRELETLGATSSR